MSKQDIIPRAPSLAKILMATVVALIVAAIVLVVAVLPAEYGIDPIGAGKALGLTQLAAAGEEPAAAAAPSSDSSPVLAPVFVPSPTGGAPTYKNLFIAQPARYKIDSRDIVLGPGEGIEIKFNLKKSAALIYSWKSTAKVAYEFHGEPDRKPEGKAGTDYYETYDLDDEVGKDQGHGTFLAPTTGIHGWFWHNKTTEPVTINLVSAGYYDWLTQNRNNKYTTIEPMDPK
jgi:hypothetical protein